MLKVPFVILILLFIFPGGFLFSSGKSEEKMEADLLQAVEQNDTVKVKQILDKAPHITELTGEQVTAICHAITFGYAEIINLFVAHGLNFHGKDSSKEAIVQKAVKEMKQNPEIIRILINAGARLDFFKGDIGMSPLSYAVCNDYYEIMDTFYLSLIGK